MYNFLLSMWINKRIDQDYLDEKVAKGRITEQEQAMVLSTSQRL